ncbi:MAG: alanine--tRNA ligase [Prevotella sp.]|nr:alanine--tRNA ligase [Staphylococcus sp.]MCM1349735.1 alanine--tRNA ligase [Prevotella sp.]
MKNLTGSQIRQMWLDFFSSKGHDIIPSASLVPQNDPTLLWINAGVAPLKKYFDGREVPVNPRMCNAQKSIRTNDIDNVGKTARHHTFFEMLGNFSIGDYFREDVLTWAYELLFDPKWYGFDPEKIYITYYPDDQETFQKWKSLGIDTSHLIPIADNFWEIGEGPCGPDTEIFYDRGEDYDPNHIGIRLLEEDIENDRYIEIWNIVFSQYNSVSGLSREDYPELPSKNIDTGSGLERLACIFQNTETNYETDLFMPMIRFLEEKTGHSYQNQEDKMAFRVIVDHIRSVTFAIADGATLSNEGRGYVLRRILRRAVRYGKTLGLNEPFLYQLVSIVVDNMKSFYSYLVEKQSIIEKIIQTEEENFLKTLSTGEKKLNDIMKVATKHRISGVDAFLLYDTFGFPIELTEEVANSNGYSVDMEAFQQELQKQKIRARKARNDEQSMNVQNEDYLKFHLPSSFIGYDNLSSISTVIGLFQNGKLVEKGHGLIQIIFNQTPFYAEMGGQVGDKGVIQYQDQEFAVLDTFRLPNGQHAHTIDMKSEFIQIGSTVKTIVDEPYRKAVCQNHSATHLLNQALREVLGGHVVQQGSQVSSEGLRFDFNHYQNLTVEQILDIEKLVQDVIHRDLLVCTIETTMEEAKKRGAQALFGEKYGESVRLVDMDFSKELCGGTHVNSTGEIQNFAITSIESKGSGIFRMEAITGEQVGKSMEKVIGHLKNEIIEIHQKMSFLIEKAKGEGYALEYVDNELPALMGSYQDVLNYRDCFEYSKKCQKQLEKSYDIAKRTTNSADYKQYESQMNLIQSCPVLVAQVKAMDMNGLKDMVDKIAADYEKCVIFFANVFTEEQKVIFLAKSKQTSINCGLLVKTAALTTGGNGGGRPDFAQAGGKDIEKVADALQIVREKIACGI